MWLDNDIDFDVSPKVVWDEAQVKKLVYSFYKKPNKFNQSAESNIWQAIDSMLPNLPTNIKRWIVIALRGDEIIDKAIREAVKFTYDKLLNDWFLTLPILMHYNIRYEIHATIAHINYLRYNIRNDSRFRVWIKYALLYSMQSEVIYWDDTSACPAIFKVFSFLFKDKIDNSLIHKNQHNLLKCF